MGMRITLVSPSAHDTYSKIMRSAKRQPTLGPAYLIACLRNKKHTVRYLDADALDLIGESAVREILKTDPEIIGISLTTSLFAETKKISRALRQSGWRGHLTLGGIHPSSLPEETLRMIPEADSAVLDEGEIAVVKLAELLERKEPLSEGIGLVYRIQDCGEEKVVFSKRPPEMISCLDELPLPALDTYPMERYVSPLWTEGLAKRMGVLITARGCPFRCVFCASGAGCRLSYRQHGIGRVLEEIKRLRNDYRADYLIFNDDTFTADKKRCLAICRGMEKENLCLPFMITSRVDTVDRELLSAMKNAGLFMVTYGIESGSQKILDAIGKKVTLEKIRGAIGESKVLGLKTIGNYMFGHWEDTAGTCRETLEFARELACDISQFAITIPYPGTQLYRRAFLEGRIPATEDYRDFGYYGNAPWQHPVLSAGELIAFQKEAYDTFPNR